MKTVPLSYHTVQCLYTENTLKNNCHFTCETFPFSHKYVWSGVGIVPKLWDVQFKVRIPVGTRDCSLSPKCPNWFRGPMQSPIQWIWEFFPSGEVGVGSKAADASSSLPPSSAEVKNKWCCISTPCMPTLWTGTTVLQCVRDWISLNGYYQNIRL